MEANNNNDENHDHDQQQQQADDNAANDDDENEEEDAIAAAVLLKLHTILQRRKDFTLRQRNKIVELAEEYIEGLGNDIHDMLCDQNHGENYHGLDSNRDTEAEVETALQFYPHLLSRRKDVRWDDEEDEWINAGDGEGDYPIQCLLKLCGPTGYAINSNALPFVAPLAQLGKDLDQFEDHERGGLLIDDEHGWNTLQYLATHSAFPHEEENNQRVDIVCRTQFIQLRRMDLFIQADIPRYELVHNLCFQDCFAENTFQFLVEWCPISLIHIDADGDVPIYYAAQESTIEAFRTIFEYMIRYYPNKKGISILFTKNGTGQTAFQIACEKYGKDGVMRFVEDTLNTSVIPLNIVEAIVLVAADENTHLDCVYFLLRRKSDVLVRLLSEPHNNNNKNNNDDDDDDGGGGGEDDHNNNGDTVDDKNEKDEDADNDGDTVDHDNHDEEDENNEDGGNEDSNRNSKYNGTGTRKRKRNRQEKEDGGPGEAVLVRRLLPLGPNDNNNNNDDGSGNYNNGNAVVDGDSDIDNDSDGGIVENNNNGAGSVPENE